MSLCYFGTQIIKDFFINFPFYKYWLQLYIFYNFCHSVNAIENIKYITDNYQQHTFPKYKLFFKRIYTIYKTNKSLFFIFWKLFFQLMRRTMESVAAERLNKIGIRDHNITNGSASENENTSAGIILRWRKIDDDFS